MKEDLIDAGLAAQSEALLGGDLATYLSFVDAPLHPEFTQRFHSLRALHVARWTARVSSTPLDPDDRSTVDVTTGYCLGDADCVPAEMVLESRWTVRDGKAVATMFQRTTLPWDVTALEAVAGLRVIVAAPASLAGQLQQTLAAAEQAADVADRFARWDRPRSATSSTSPGRSSGVTGGSDAERPDTYAVDSYGVAVQAGQTGRDGLQPAGRRVRARGEPPPWVRHAERAWWLSEGSPSTSPTGTAPGRGIGCRSCGAICRPTAGTVWSRSRGIAAGHDGRRPAARSVRPADRDLPGPNRFVEDRMLAFFAAVVRDGPSPETVCADGVRHPVGAGRRGLRRRDPRQGRVMALLDGVHEVVRCAASDRPGADGRVGRGCAGGGRLARWGLGLLGAGDGIGTGWPASCRSSPRAPQPWGDRFPDLGDRCRRGETGAGARPPGGDAVLR